MNRAIRDGNEKTFMRQAHKRYLLTVSFYRHFQLNNIINSVYSKHCEVHDVARYVQRRNRMTKRPLRQAIAMNIFQHSVYSCNDYQVSKLHALQKF